MVMPRNRHLLCVILILIATPLTATGQAQPPVCKTVTADQRLEPDGLNTSAIQAALDGCASSNGPQTAVELSAGKGANFTSGALYLPSNVVLWLDAGVTLNASTNPSDFQRTASSRTQACDGSGAIPMCGTLDPANTGPQPAPRLAY